MQLENDKKNTIKGLSVTKNLAKISVNQYFGKLSIEDQ